jgi:hypothetical protein
VHSRKAIFAFCRLAHRTLSGAPPDSVRCGFLSFFGEADRWRFGAVGAPDTVRCTPDSPVPLPTIGTCHASRADSAADRWPGRLLAHRTVRCTPDSPVNYSRTLLITSREQQVRLSQPGAPDTVRCTTGHCPVHLDRAAFWLYLANFSPKQFLLFLALRHNTLVFKSMYQV